VVGIDVEWGDVMPKFGGSLEDLKFNIGTAIPLVFPW
jgi:hypothetical protein